MFPKSINIDYFIKSVKRSIAYEELRDIKKTMHKDGLKYQHSFYYFVKVNKESLYRRVEIVSLLPFTKQQIKYLHNIFSQKVSGWDYALWIFYPFSYSLAFIHGIDRRDR